MVSVVISYCSLDRRFVEATVRQSFEFSQDVLMVCFDHLLNGDAEDPEALQEIARIDARLRILVLPFEAAKGSKYHHNLARWIGAQHAVHEWCLFLDADEVPEGPLVNEFLAQPLAAEVDALYLTCHWYFRRPEYQALQTEDNILLVRKRCITPSNIFTDTERWGFLQDPAVRHLSKVGLAGRPMFHHYSWVRTREEMLKKVSGWAHRHERDWVGKVEREFQHEFAGTDFVHGYQYRLVPNQFGLRMD